MNEKNVPNIQLLSEETLFQNILAHKDAMAYLCALNETNPLPWKTKKPVIRSDLFWPTGNISPSKDEFKAAPKRLATGSFFHAE